MTEPTEQVGKGDHRFEAARWIAAAEREASTLNAREAQAFAAVAQVHATLAVHDQLERLNDKLDAGGITDAVHAAINEIIYAFQTAASGRTGS